MDKTMYALILSILIGSIIFGMIGMVSAEDAQGGPSSSHCQFMTTEEGCNTLYGGNFCLWNEQNNSCGPRINSNTCVEKNGSCCLGEVCNFGSPNCIEETDPVFQGCDNNCMANVSCVANDVSGCKNLYWFDNDNKECGQEQFCGMYMYYGLQTFESKTLCEKALNETCACTMDAKICPDGSAVGRVCQNCYFADCKNKYCDSEENGTCYKTLSNGRKAEIKIMPDTASATAIARLGELNFTIELKKVGKGDNAKPVYELTGNKEGKFLGIFKIMTSEKVQVDAETGDVKVIKPWWSFLATGI